MRTVTSYISSRFTIKILNNAFGRKWEQVGVNGRKGGRSGRGGRKENKGTQGCAVGRKGAQGTLRAQWDQGGAGGVARWVVEEGRHNL